MDKDLQEQWKMKQVNVLDVGTGIIFLFFNFDSLVYTTDKKWICKKIYKGKTLEKTILIWLFSY